MRVRGSLPFIGLLACARIEPPPGGPPDAEPPQLIATVPDSMAQLPDFHGDVEFRFDEVIAEGSTASTGTGTGDLEKLNNYYLDRGYVDFNIDSTQVSISPDRQDMFISAGVSEGDQYTVSSVQLTGDTVLPKEELQRMVIVREGQIFSRRLLELSSDSIIATLGTSFAVLVPKKYVAKTRILVREVRNRSGQIVYGSEGQARVVGGAIVVDDAALEALRAQEVGEPVGALVEFPVGHRLAGPGHDEGRAVRVVLGSLACIHEQSPMRRRRGQMPSRAASRPRWFMSEDQTLSLERTSPNNSKLWPFTRARRTAWIG